MDPTKFMDVSQYMRPKDQVTDDTDSSSENSSPRGNYIYPGSSSSDSDSDDDVVAAAKLGLTLGKTLVRHKTSSGEMREGVVVRRAFPFFVVQFGSEEAKFTAAQLQQILEWDAKEKRDRLRRRMPYVISRQLILRKAPSGGGPIGRFVRRHYLPDSEELFRVVVSFL